MNSQTHEHNMVNMNTWHALNSDKQDVWRFTQTHNHLIYPLTDNSEDITNDMTGEFAWVLINSCEMNMVWVNRWQHKITVDHIRCTETPEWSNCLFFRFVDSQITESTNGNYNSMLIVFSRVLSHCACESVRYVSARFTLIVEARNTENNSTFG